jgi:hypothetical protein
MPDDEFLEAIAEALEAAASVLRDRSARLKQRSPAESNRAPNPAERAKALHPQLGPRQEEIITELTKAGGRGTGTGAIVRAIGYDQPDVYLTLRSLQKLGFAEKDTSAKPHIYRLGPRLRDENWPDSTR